MEPNLSSDLAKLSLAQLEQLLDALTVRSLRLHLQPRTASLNSDTKGMLQ